MIWLSLPVFEVIEKTTNAAVAIAPMINMLVTMMLSMRHHSPLGLDKVQLVTCCCIALKSVVFA